MNRFHRTGTETTLPHLESGALPTPAVVSVWTMHRHWSTSTSQMSATTQQLCDTVPTHSTGYRCQARPTARAQRAFSHKARNQKRIDGLNRAYLWHPNKSPLEKKP